MEFWVYLILIGFHWLGDFLMTTKWVTSEETTNADALGLHTIIYTSVVAVPIGFICLSFKALLLFSSITLAFHICVDALFAVLARDYLYKRDYNSAWICIGLDQCLHVGYLITMGHLTKFVFIFDN